MDGRPTQAWFWLGWGSSTVGTDGTFPVASLDRDPERSAEEHTPHSFVRLRLATGGRGRPSLHVSGDREQTAADHVPSWVATAPPMRDREFDWL